MRLRTNILNFVNSVAEIVHSNAQHWGGGQCNKNLGNAFVIIWRLGDETSLAGVAGAGRRGSRNVSAELGAGGGAARRQVAHAQTVDLRRVPDIDRQADRALIAFLKIIAELNRNKKTLDYRRDPLLTNNEQQKYAVRMSFGLHGE